MPGSAPTESNGQVLNKAFPAVSVSLTNLAAIFVGARIIYSWQRKVKHFMHHINDCKFFHNRPKLCS